MMHDGYFFDGKTSKQHEVTLGYGHEHLTVRTEQARYYWQAEDVTLISNMHDGLPMRLGNAKFPEQRLEIHDANAWHRVRDTCPNLGRTQFHVPANLGVIAGGLVLSIFLVWGMFAAIPVVSETFAPFVPDSAKTALSDMVREELFAEHKICKNPEGVAALKAMKARMKVPAAISLNVINHEMTNAVTLPDDSITFFEGLLQKAESPEEVAGVLAHELGHVEHQHVAKNLVRAFGTQFMFALMTGGTSSAVDGRVVLNVLMQNGFQRDAEHEADDFAVHYLQAQAINPDGYLKFFERAKDTPKALAYISTHPAHDKRIERISSQLDNYEETPVLNKDEWKALQNICNK